MHPQTGSPADGTSIHQIVEDLLGERIEALASWIQELDAQVRTTAAAGDEKTLKELRKALEAWTKRDPKFEERLTERVDVLADRLATLSSTVNTTAAARASSEGDLAALRRELEQETAKLHATLGKHSSTDVSRELQELRHTVAHLDRGAGRRKEDDAGPPREIENLGVRIDMLAKTVATTAAGLAGREGDLASLRRSLEETSGKVDQIVASLPRSSDASEIARLDAKLADLGEKILDATSALAERERAAASLRTRVEEQGTKLETFAKAVRDSLQVLNGRIADVAAKDDGAAALAELTAHVTSLGGRLDAGDPRYDDLRTRLDTFSSQLVAASAERAASTDEIATLRRQVDESGVRFDAAVAELRGLLAALPTEPSLTEVEARLDPLQAQVDTLAEKIDASGTHFEGTLTELRRLVDALATASSVADLEARLAPLQTQLEALAARIVEADARTAERLERETSQVERLEQKLDDANIRLEQVSERQAATAAEADVAKSGSELERAWVREQMDAIVSAVADTASRADLEAFVGDLERRLEGLVGEQTALSAEIARTREAALGETERLTAEIASTREAALGETERLEAELRALPEPIAAQPDLEPLVSDLKRRLEDVIAEQSTRTAELASSHEALHSQLRRLETEVSALPEPTVPIPPSEDAQLRRLLTAFADRIDAMERDRATIAAESAEAAQSHVEQVRPLVEGLRRRVDESERRLEALGPTDELNATLDELAARIQALEERPVAPPQPAPLPGDGRFRVELRALELRMQHAEAAARENREAVLVQLERLASRVEWRLQQLENQAQPEPEQAQEEPSLGQVVPIRGGADT